MHLRKCREASFWLCLSNRKGCLGIVVLLFLRALPIFSEEKILRQGLTYEHLVTDVPQSIYILRIDPVYFDIKPVRALDDGIGRERCSSLSLRHQACAAINGGFFKIAGNFDGLPMGILKIEGDWFMLPHKPRGAIGWTKDKQAVLIDRVLATCVAVIENKSVPLDGLNRPRKPREKIAYTPNFHRTTLTDPYGCEIVIKNDRVQGVAVQKGSNAIPMDGWILSLADPVGTQLLTALAKDKPAFLTYTIVPQGTASHSTSEQWGAMDYIVGGTPVLVQNSRAIADFGSEQTITTFLTNRHARTAIGILKDKRWVFVVVDRKPQFSEGMTIEELAQFMLTIGCFDALNLDGGGSSTLVINHAVVNQPYGNQDEEDKQGLSRRVSDAILILAK
jgi:hypothetical protein